MREEERDGITVAFPGTTPQEAGVTSTCTERSSVLRIKFVSDRLFISTWLLGCLGYRRSVALSLQIDV